MTSSTNVPNHAPNQAQPALGDHDLFDWVRAINPNLKSLDSIPLIGSSPPFPWEELSNRLSRTFEQKKISIVTGEMGWRSKEDLYEGLGDKLFPLTFTIPSLKGQVTWVMPEQEVSAITAKLLIKEVNTSQNNQNLTFNLSDTTLIDSFYRFLTLEVLHQLTQVPFDKSLIPVLNQKANLPDQDSLCWDISIQLDSITYWGRLILTEEFRHSWIGHFEKKQSKSLYRQKMEKLVEVAVHLEVGQTEMTLAEWNSVQLGDFILLDYCSLEGDQFNGKVKLTLNGKQLFQAKLKEGTLKIEP